MFFPLICNSLKMEAYSNNFQRHFLAKNPCDCNQIRPDQIAEPFSFLINQKDIKDHMSEKMVKTPITAMLRRLKDVSPI